jgi:DNA (cytosine-5)-methyltransferase 1
MAQEEQSSDAFGKVADDDASGNSFVGRKIKRNENDIGAKKDARNQCDEGQMEKIRHERPFILSGGFPCPSFSQAGKRRGTKDPRWLWPSMFAIIHFLRPEWVVAENVGGFVTWEGGLALDKVLADLEGAGYEAWPFVIPAVAVGAPHRRDRVWIVAHRTGTGAGSNDKGIRQEPIGNGGGQGTDASDAIGERLQGRGKTGKKDCDGTEHGDEQFDGRGRGFDTNEWDEDWYSVALRTCVRNLDDGLSGELVVLPDGTKISHSKWRQEALKGLGNAWCPPVAIEIMKAIRFAEEQRSNQTNP